MSHNVTLIQGDWVGPEVAAVVQRLLATAGADINWDVQSCGIKALENQGESLPDEAIESIKRNKYCLKGRLHGSPDPDAKSPTVRLRQQLDLFYNFRPVRNVWNLPARYPKLDLLIVREGTEDVYAGREHTIIPGVVEALKVVTERGSERIAHEAFKLAKAQGRKKVTTVHKANIMKLADGLFLRTAQRVGKEYPEIEHNSIIVDNLSMQLVSRPYQFDVLLMGNLFGDIISDLCTGLIGGIAQVPSVSRGSSGVAIFEALHGQAPELVGKDLANPLPFLTPAILLLRELGMTDEANRVEAATLAALAAGIKTRDLGGDASLSEFEQAILKRMK